MTPKRRSRKLRPLEINKEKRFKLASILSPNRKCFMVTQCSLETRNSQKESIYLSSRVYRCRDSVSSISSVKNSPANTIKIDKLSAVVLNLASDKLDSDKKPNIAIKA